MPDRCVRLVDSGTHSLDEANRERTILVVDDEPEILSFLELALSEDGYHVATATNGQEALAYIEQRTPELILLDARMPEMSGAEFIRQLRDRHGVALPVVLVTAAWMRGSDVADLGAQGLLAKPFDLADLQACVARYLEPLSKTSH